MIKQEQQEAFMMYEDAEEEGSDEVQEVEPSEVGEFAPVHANDPRIN